MARGLLIPVIYQPKIELIITFLLNKKNSICEEIINPSSFIVFLILVPYKSISTKLMLIDQRRAAIAVSLSFSNGIFQP